MTGLALISLVLVAPTSSATALSATASGATAPSTAPSATAPTGPQLSIAIDNGRTSTTVGDKLDYVITISNMGTADIDGLLITQTLPTGLTFGTADSGGTAGPSNVSWTVDVKATETATLHTSMTVTATPAELLRLATVACASMAADGPPIVCAAHSDQLPAGAAADASLAAMQAAPVSEGQQPWWYVLAGLVAVVLLGGVGVLLVLRRRQRVAATDEQSASDTHNLPVG